LRSSTSPTRRVVIVEVDECRDVDEIPWLHDLGSRTV
jgi:hypothetical protein